MAVGLGTFGVAQVVSIVGDRRWEIPNHDPPRAARLSDVITCDCR